MKAIRQKIILIIIPILCIMNFLCLKKGYIADIFAVQNYFYSIADLMFIIVADILITILLLFFDTHLMSNIAAGICFAAAVALYNLFNSAFGLFTNTETLIYSIFYSYITAYLLKYSLAKSNRRLINAILGAYFTKKNRRHLLAGLKECEPVLREITILECSVYDLERLVSANLPKELFYKINFLLDAVISSVLQNGGRIDKFVGTKIYAYWDRPEKSCYAVKAALEACKLLRTSAFINDIKFSIGIHYAKAYIGLLGNSKIMNYSLISPAIETVDIVTAACSLYNKKILISKEVYKQAWRNVSAIKTASVNLRGSALSTDVYEPLNFKDGNA